MVATKTNEAMKANNMKQKILNRIDSLINQYHECPERLIALGELRHFVMDLPNEPGLAETVEELERIQSELATVKSNANRIYGVLGTVEPCCEICSGQHTTENCPAIKG